MTRQRWQVRWKTDMPVYYDATKAGNVTLSTRSALSDETGRVTAEDALGSGVSQQ